MIAAGILILLATAAVLGAQRRIQRRPDELATENGLTGQGGVLLDRYVDRADRFRRTGTLVGFTVAGTVWLVYQAAVEPAAVTLALAPVAAVGLTGSLLGTIAAEVFRFRRPLDVVRTASLSRREDSLVDDAVVERRESLVVIAAIGAGAYSFAAASPLAAVLAGVAVLLIPVRRWAQHRIVTRPRSALPADVAEADTVIRRLAAVHGIGRPAMAAAVLILSVSFGHLASDDGTPGSALASIVLLVVGIVWWWTGRSYGGSRLRMPAVTIRSSRIAAGLGAVLIAFIAVGRLM